MGIWLIIGRPTFKQRMTLRPENHWDGQAYTC
jgi:hypothetical protein